MLVPKRDSHVQAGHGDRERRMEIPSGSVGVEYDVARDLVGGPEDVLKGRFAS